MQAAAYYSRILTERWSSGFALKSCFPALALVLCGNIFRQVFADDVLMAKRRFPVNLWNDLAVEKGYKMQIGLESNFDALSPHTPA